MSGVWTEESVQKQTPQKKKQSDPAGKQLLLSEEAKDKRLARRPRAAIWEALEMTWFSPCLPRGLRGFCRGSVIPHHWARGRVGTWPPLEPLAPPQARWPSNTCQDQG